MCTTKTDTSYNGWTNRSTWLVSLWIQDCPIDELQEPHKRECFTVAEERIFALAAALEEWFQEYTANSLNEVLENSIFADLIGGAIREIDWHDVAESWVEDVAWFD